MILPRLGMLRTEISVFTYARSVLVADGAIARPAGHLPVTQPGCDRSTLDAGMDTWLAAAGANDGADAINADGCAALRHQPGIRICKCLYIVDLKSCAGSPTQRLSTCPLEFQSEHYLGVGMMLCDDHIWSDLFDLPEDVHMGGFIHIAAQKPTINFGQKDRPRVPYEHIFQRGPRAGRSEIRYEYTSDVPSWDVYMERCTDWYLSQGEYEHLAPERVDDPVVNASTVVITSTTLRGNTVTEHASTSSSSTHAWMRCRATSP